jgi:hypothetical protein
MSPKTESTVLEGNKGPASTSNDKQPSYRAILRRWGKRQPEKGQGKRLIYSNKRSNAKNRRMEEKRLLARLRRLERIVEAVYQV